MATESPNRNLSITNMDDMLTLAEDIKKFIDANKLSTNVQGKNFPQAEAWQYAGNRLNILQKAGYIKNVSDSTEIKYEASVELLDASNNFAVIGQGFAVCSNKEQGKKYYQEFAIASMAQTRAIGKAYRILLSFVMRLAGYEPTPAEEMDYDTNKEPKASQPSKNTPSKEQAQPAAEDAALKEELEKLKATYLRGLNHELVSEDFRKKEILKIHTLTTEELAGKIKNISQKIKDLQNKQG